MADRIPIVIEGSTLREISNGDRVNISGNALQVGGNITPDTDSAYDIGTSSLKFKDIHLSSGTIHLGGVKLKADGGQLSIQDSTGAAAPIAAASLQTNTTDDLTEGSSNLFYTTARADSAARSALVGIDAGGDGSFSYDSATGKFTYTGPSASEARAHVSATDAGGDGSFSYDASTGVFTYTGPSATEIRSHFQALNANGFGSLTFDSATGTFTYTGFTGDSSRQLFDSALGDATSAQTIRNYFSFSDQGGDGSFSYDSSTGVFTYVGPSASDVRAHITANKGVSIASGEINVDSANIRAIFSAIDSGGDGAFSYEQDTGKFIYRGPSAAEVRAHINVVDAGGDGSFAYDSSLGKLTYTGPSAAEARAHVSATDAGGDGSFAYNASTGVFTYTGPSPAETRAHINVVDAGGDGSFAYDSALGKLTYTGPSASEVRAKVSATDAGGDGSFAYNSSTGVFTYTGPSASEVRAHVSVTDAGGDGSLSYNNSNGVFTYTGPSATEVRAKLVAGSGIVYDSAAGRISTSGQGLASTDSVTFAGLYVSGNTIIGGDFTVNGTTTTINSENKVINDHLFGLNDGVSGGTNNTDIGFIFERGTTGNNATFAFIEASDKFQLGTTADSPGHPGNLTISTGTLIANIEGNVTGNVTGNVSGSSGSTTGNAATATALQNARTIGGVSFDGTGNINLPGVNTSGNQNTSGTAAVATAITVSDNESTNENNHILFGAGGAGSGNIGVEADGNMTYNPSTGKITATGFVGALEGNATTATTLATGRTFSLTGDVTASAVSFNGSGNIALATTIAANSVALGTDTTGNYVQQGATSGNGISGSVNSEGGTFTVTSNATNANNASTIVFRDGSGNFSAGTITATLSGNASTATSATSATNSTNATNFNVAADNSTNSSHFVVFVGGATGNQRPNSDTGLTYNPSSNTLSTSTFSGALSGNATTATRLQTARTIGGVSFNGTANINLPGVNTSGNQNTSGNAATATALQNARTIGGVSFNGTSNINLPGVNTSGNQNTSGTATNATNFNVAADNSTNATHYVIFTGGATGNQRPNSDTGLTYNPSSGALSTNTFSGALSGNATTATRLQTARTISLTGNVTGSTSFNGSGNVSISCSLAANSVNSNELASASTLQIKNTSGSVLKTVIGAGN
tara:strand:+ start:170 stop:3634 length:3465 start_codon:yes stop_codon:yes gene_type:complete